MKLFCRVGALVAILTMSVLSVSQASDWVQASSYTDAENKWTGETAAYDLNTATYAVDQSNRVGFGAVLKLNYATPVNSDRVRVSTDFGYGIVDKVKLTVTYNDNSTVSTEYTGTVVHDVTASTLTFTKGLVKSVEYSFHYTATGYYFWLYDLQLYQCPEAPAALSGTTLDPTSVNATSAVLHGKVVSNGGTPCYGRFVYWKTVDAKVYTAWRGDLSNNQEFTTALSGLDQNATYSCQTQLAPSATPASGDIVTCDPVKTFTTVKVDETSTADWVSPSSAWADAGTWQNPDQAMDDDTATGATFYHQINADTWSPYIHFGTDMQSNGIRLWAQSTSVDQVGIDILKDGTWQSLYQGVFTGDAWQQFPFAKGQVTEARIRLHVSAGNVGIYWNLVEVDFHQKDELRTTRFFVGTGADWSSAANWSASSGGTGGASVPASGSVAVFDANSPSCTLSANVSVEVLRLTSGFTGTLDAGTKSITIERDRGFGELSVAGGELKLGSATHTIKDNFRFTGGTITPGTSTVGFLAPNDGSFEIAGSIALNNVRFYHSNNGSNHKVLSISGTVTANGSLSLEGYDSGGWDLYLNGGEIVAKGAITGNGKVIRGTSNLTISGDAGDQTQTGLFWGTSGTYTVNKPAGKLIFGANEKFGDPTTSGNAQTKMVLISEVDASSAQQTIWLCGYGYGAVTITGNLTAYNVSFYRMGGTGTSVYDVSGYTLTVLNNLDLNIPGGGGWHVNFGGGTIACKGNVTATDVTAANWSGVNFVINGSGNQSIALGGLPVSTISVEKTGGTVSFPDGITSTAINFSPGSSVIFGAGKTVQASAICWRGAEGQPIVLRSSIASQRWMLGLPSRYEMGDSYVEWVDVQDSDASLGESVVEDVAGIDSGNNVNWDFLLPIDVRITTPAASATSPAWVGGTSGPNITELDVSVNGGAAFAATRETVMKWYANNSSTTAMGIPLSATEATTVLVKGRSCSGREGSATMSVVWTPTDVRGKDAARDSITIRQGDSLLVTANGSEGEELLEIDADGDGVYEYAGVPDEKFASAYNAAGVFTARAKIDGAEVGTLKVVVVKMDLHGPIACQVGYQREKDALVEPPEAISCVVFTTSDPDALSTSVKGPIPGGAVLYLGARKRGSMSVQARLGSADGPVVATTPVDAFELDMPACQSMLANGNTNRAQSTVTIRPYIPNLRVEFSTFAHQTTLVHNGEEVVNYSVNTTDAFEQIYDETTNELVGSYVCEFAIANGETAYCVQVTANQASSQEKTVGRKQGNGQLYYLRLEEMCVSVQELSKANSTFQILGHKRGPDASELPVPLSLIDRDRKEKAKGKAIFPATFPKEGTKNKEVPYPNPEDKDEPITPLNTLQEGAYDVRVPPQTTPQWNEVLFTKILTVIDASAPTLVVRDTNSQRYEKATAGAVKDFIAMEGPTGQASLILGYWRSTDNTGCTWKITSDEAGTVILKQGQFSGAIMEPTVVPLPASRTIFVHGTKPGYESIVVRVKVLAISIARVGDWSQAVAGIKRPSPGNTLTFRATIIPNTEQRTIRFALQDVSHERGINMNEGDDVGPDITFERQAGFLDPTGDKQTVQEDNSADNTAVTILTAHDYGAYGHIKASIVGLDGIETAPIDILIDNIPAGEPNHIEDAWDNANVTPGGMHWATEDEDGSPTGNGKKGDRLSRYDEYRGFTVSGQYISTSPNQKDVFIQNKTGEDISEGLKKQIEKLGVTVHIVVEGEFDNATRRINRNGGFFKQRVVVVENSDQTEGNPGRTSAQQLPSQYEFCRVWVDLLKNAVKLERGVADSDDISIFYLESTGIKPAPWQDSGKVRVETEVIQYEKGFASSVTESATTVGAPMRADSATIMVDKSPGTFLFVSIDNDTKEVVKMEGKVRGREGTIKGIAKGATSIPTNSAQVETPPAGTFLYVKLDDGANTEWIKYTEVTEIEGKKCFAGVSRGQLDTKDVDHADGTKFDREHQYTACQRHQCGTVAAEMPVGTKITPIGVLTKCKRGVDQTKAAAHLANVEMAVYRSATELIANTAAHEVIHVLGEDSHVENTIMNKSHSRGVYVGNGLFENYADSTKAKVDVR